MERLREISHCPSEELLLGQLSLLPSKAWRDVLPLAHFSRQNNIMVLFKARVNYTFDLPKLKGYMKNMQLKKNNTVPLKV